MLVSRFCMKTPPVHETWSKDVCSLSAGAERAGQVVAAVDHQPVPEPVDALVEQELAPFVDRR